MREQIAKHLHQTSLAPVLVVWTFGYLLVDIVGFLLGRSATGVLFVMSAPLLILGVVQTMALQGLRETTGSMAPTLRVVALGAAVVLATALQASFDLYWLRWVSLTLVPDWQQWTLNINLQRLSTAGVLYLWTFGLSLTLLWAMHFRSEAHAAVARAASAEATAAKAEATAAKAEAAALRLQLNPHFMFNALNSVSSLVMVDEKEQAEEMILRLCDFLRASLETDPMADVPLAREIDVLKAYLGIEAARVGKRLTVSFQVDPSVEDAAVPNYILQPLVENAIKHGISRSRGCSMLQVSALAQQEDLVLCVVNSVEEPTSDQIAPLPRRSGIGLHNTRERLATRYGSRARLKVCPLPTGFRATIALPLERHGLSPAFQKHSETET